MGQKIRIAQVITGLHYGGAEKLLLTIAEEIDRSKFEMDIYCVICGGELVPEFERLGYKVQIFSKAYVPYRHFPCSISETIRLANALREGRYHIVHTHLYAADLVGRIAAIIAGIPIIVRSIHNIEDWKKWVQLSWDRLLSKWTHEVICCSEYMRGFAIQQERLAEGKVKKIYHGVNLARFDIKIDREKYALEIGLHPARKTVGTVGRLIELKGHEYFLKSVPLILEKHPETQFLIVGDGHLREPLIASVSGMRYKDRIFFLGSRGDIPELLRLMDVFVFPSSSEGLGIASIEAMAAGVPVVASNIRPISEVVLDGETGILVESSNPETLAGAVNQLLSEEDTRKRFGINGRIRSERFFSHTTMVKEYQEIYLELADRLLGAEYCKTQRAPIS